jgi:DNA-binding MarR family transcriptional regulator
VAKTPELGNLVDMLGVELRIAQILADRVFGQVNSPKMPPGHFTVLSLIRLNPGINQSALARCMYLDRSTMVPILDQFEKKGWLERRAKANDRRAYALFLTAAGEKTLARAETQVVELEDRIRRRMGPRNRQKLLGLIKELQQTLQTIDAAHP